MKLNWGHYIAISFTLFVMLILYMVYRSYQNNHDLVAEDYYKQEIEFQNVIDKKSRAEALEHNVTWESQNQGILLSFPELGKEIEGEIRLFRPSDKSKDVSFKILLDDKNQQFLKDASFVHGKYLIYIDWKAGEAEYFTEGTAYVIQ